MSKAAPVVMLWGEHLFLLRDAAREIFGEVHPQEIDGGEWQGGLTGDLATPSLFGEQRGLLVANAQDLSAEAAAEVGRYATAPSPDARLVLAFVVSSRSKGPPKKVLEVLGTSVEVRRVAVDRKELPAWVAARAKARGMPATPQGAKLLVDTLGEDPAALDQAVEQLASSHAREGLTPVTVNAQFRGLGERRIWDLTDAAFTGNVAGAMRTLTALLDAGEEPLALLGGIASRLRDLIRVRALPPKIPLAEVARQAGLRFDWQARRYLQQAGNFSLAELVRVHERITEVDRALKSGGTADVIMPTLITEIAAPRS